MWAVGAGRRNRAAAATRSCGAAVRHRPACAGRFELLRVSRRPTLTPIQGPRAELELDITRQRVPQSRRRGSAEREHRGGGRTRMAQGRHRATSARLMSDRHREQRSRPHVHVDRTSRRARQSAACRPEWHGRGTRLPTRGPDLVIGRPGPHVWEIMTAGLRAGTTTRMPDIRPLTSRNIRATKSGHWPVVAESAQHYGMRSDLRFLTQVQTIDL
jgi:hypothetical protein